MKYSVNHHYIPVFFQKGFCNEKGLIYVYDKLEDKIYPPSTPQRRFYKKNLNNAVKDGNIYLSTEESFYDKMDKQGAQIVRKIIQNTTSADITDDVDKVHLLSFMSHLFWRSPSTDDLFASLIEKEGLCNEYFGLYNEKTGEPYTDESDMVAPMKEKMVNDPEFAKIFKILIPSSDGGRRHIVDLVDKWKLFELNPKCEMEFLLGDVPFVWYNPNQTIRNTFDRIIFPICKYKVLILNENKSKFIDELIIRNINLSILKLSNRFVGSSSKENLEYFVDFYK